MTSSGSTSAISTCEEGSPAGANVTCYGIRLGARRVGRFAQRAMSCHDRPHVPSRPPAPALECSPARTAWSRPGKDPHP